jgi:hypothetical protein
MNGSPSQRNQLAEVVRLYKADRTREETYLAIQARIGAAIDAVTAQGPEAVRGNPLWCVVMAGSALSQMLTRIVPATFAQSADGALAVRSQRNLDWELF